MFFLCPANRPPPVALTQDLDLRALVKAACALLDIPVHDPGNPIEAMHLLFSLLAELQAGPYFAEKLRQLAAPPAAAGGAAAARWQG